MNSPFYDTLVILKKKIFFLNLEKLHSRLKCNLAGKVTQFKFKTANTGQENGSVVRRRAALAEA